jgi:hypothetical protein
MVVRHRTGARVLSLALAAMARGIRAVSRTPALDAFLVDACTVEHHRPTIAVDGELVTESEILEYRVVRAALRIVGP